MTYHQFTNETGETYGSFETFFTCGSFEQDSSESFPAGFYWQACFPGCLPDGDPSGPFETEQDAITDANEF